jgi:hypothetical protein
MPEKRLFLLPALGLMPEKWQKTLPVKALIPV